MSAALLDNTLGQLACTLPGATRVFRQHRLDFCCGGQKSLRQAAAEQGLDGEALAAQLAELSGTGEQIDWRQVSQDDLLEHILGRYHAVHREQLPELIRLASRVEQVHGGREHCPLGLADLLMDIYQELETHMQKEEQILFPMIQGGNGPMAGGPISVMRFEHTQHGEMLERIAQLTDDMQPPVNACNTWRALYRGLDELREDLMQHIHLENNLLFARALGEVV